MIRGTAILSLVGLLILVLYVPSTHPPAYFLELLRSEHAAASVFWDSVPAYRMLDRALRLQSGAASASPVPAVRDLHGSAGIDGAISREMASVGQRLFDNEYFRSVDALLMLASYRLATLVEWLPLLLPFVLAAVFDGWLVRLVKAKEFRFHDPEMFAVWCSLLIVAACATVIACVIPIRLHPGTCAVAVGGIAALLGRATAHFHRRA